VEADKAAVAAALAVASALGLLMVADLLLGCPLGLADCGGEGDGE